TEEVERFCAVYFKPKSKQSALDHQVMNAALDPAVSRFTVLQQENEAEAESWRGKVQGLRNLYGFLSQVIPYQDSDLERLYVFLRHLAAELPCPRGPAYKSAYAGGLPRASVRVCQRGWIASSKVVWSTRSEVRHRGCDV